MNRLMPADLVAELKKVLYVLENSIRENRICRIEKDIALERLRGIYDALLNLDFFPAAEQADVLSAYLGEDKHQKETPLPEEQKEIVTEKKAGLPMGEINCEIPVSSVDELIEKSFSSHSPIDRSLIESLYGDSELCKPGDASLEIKLEALPEKETKKEIPEPQGKVLNETLTGNTRDVASMLSSQTNSLLRKAIGLNDKLMLMTDLFNNDSRLYDQTMDALDNCHSIDDAYIYLYEHFTVDNEKEGVKLLISLLESKFS